MGTRVDSQMADRHIEVDSYREDGYLDEVIRLRQRVQDLESTVAEYRSQMSLVFGSASWRMTSPIRVAAARYRTARIKAARAYRRMRSGRARESNRAVLTAGLFMPELSTLPPTSPLRAAVDVGALRRLPQADGPLRRPAGDPTVLVVAHVHFPELWGDIDDRLSRMPCPFDLFVTVTEGPAEQVIPAILDKHPRARIERVANRGRDWGPLLMLANRGLLSGYDAVAKVHTKKSEHRVDGDGWRLALLDGILESPDQIQRTIDLLREDRRVGLVVPTGHVAGTEHWGSNQGIVAALASRLPMAFDPDRLAFPAGSMFWCRPWLLERLADLDLRDEHFEPEAGQYDATTAHALERFVGIACQVAGMDIVEAMDVRSRMATVRRSPQGRPPVYAFFLPQFHQCPENDEFWGEGFTDWDNVRKAKPLFEGHRQPNLPSAEVGFYDLTDPEVLRRQARMARDHGIDGFVFHYYWFDGRKVLDIPISNWLADPTIDLPLALCWANEPWTRRWDGLEQDVLIAQNYGENWANRLWDDISPILKDPRYITVDGAPVLVIYRVGDLPHPDQAIQTWRQRAMDDGHPALHVSVVTPSRDFARWEPGMRQQVDATLTFPPGSGLTLESLMQQNVITDATIHGDVYAYASCFPAPGAGQPIDAPTTVFPGWDNTARRGARAYVFHGSNPISWAGTLRSMSASPMSPLFINSWNEWAEGACLEPSLRAGAGYLRALADVHPRPAA